MNTSLIEVNLFTIYTHIYNTNRSNRIVRLLYKAISPKIVIRANFKNYSVDCGHFTDCINGIFNELYIGEYFRGHLYV